MLLTKTFPLDTYVRALESWSWLDLAGKLPVLASLFGDVFLQDRQGYWFLDTIEGRLTMIAATQDELQTILGTEEGQDHYLLGGLAMAAERHGLRPQPGEVYGFRVPPVLGGKTELDNVIVMDFVVSVNIAGQIHDQVRDLPPGTQIAGVQIQD
jgi:Domain of unknown function (DUF1851)